LYPRFILVENSMVSGMLDWTPATRCLHNNL